MRRLGPTAIILALWLPVLGAEKFKLAEPVEYTGLCDASGAVPIGSNLFLVATDEENTLRLYRRDRGGAPLKEWDYDTFLEVLGRSREADLEGAALIGNRAFWIGSHGLNVSGKERHNRKRFFATDISTDGDSVSLTPVGNPCMTLMDELERDPRYIEFRLDHAAQFPPKAPGALDIEGLASTPEGGLLIGFRNPIPRGKALLAPLLNPNGVIQGKPARFGDPIRLALGGLGIRDIARWETTYLIIAGPYASGKSCLYRWQGPGSVPREIPLNHIGRYNPEAIIIYPDKGLSEVQILSDDGNRIVDGTPCKGIKDLRSRVFRSFWVTAKH